MSKIPTNIKLSFIIVIIIIFLKPLTNHLIIIGLAYLFDFLFTFKSSHNILLYMLGSANIIHSTTDLTAGKNIFWYHLY